MPSYTSILNTGRRTEVASSRGLYGDRKYAVHKKVLTLAMTLIVSVPVNDGIVIAGDSFTTLTTRAPQETPDPEPIKTFPHVQKILPFYDKFGIGFCGRASIEGNSATMYIREFEHELKTEGVYFDTVDEAAQTISEVMSNVDWEEDSFTLFVAGYNGQNAKIVEIRGTEDGIKVTNFEAMRCYVAGDTEVAECIAAIHGEPEDLDYPPFNLFSLQTAINYAQFLIRTTIEFQRFSRRVSTVGGAIDVAVVTPEDGFHWIQRQPISPVLQGFTSVPDRPQTRR